jgi:hypothetical protein
MTIERHDRDERQARLEWMLDEFQQARQRRLVKTGVRPVEPQADKDTSGAPEHSTARRAVSADPVTPY